MDVTEAIAEAVLQKLAPVLDKLLSDGSAVQPRLMTIKHAALYLGRSEKAVYHLVASGHLPTVRSDSRVMLDRQDLDAWIDANKS